MRAACENCGKFGEMTPGKPFVCGVCGYRHEAHAVDMRIAAAAKSAREKAEADRRASAERKAARERLAAALRPRAAPHPTISSPPRPRPAPRAEDPHVRRAPARPRAVSESKGLSGLGDFIGSLVRAIVGIVVILSFVKSCISSASVHGDDARRERLPVPVAAALPGGAE